MATPERDGNPPYDIVVIGGGPAGYASALYGASAGLKIAIIEQDRIGGTCLHRGCIPAKELLETAHVYRTVQGASEFGVTSSDPTLDLSAMHARKQSIIDRLAKGLTGLLKGRSVDLYSGRGSLGADRRVTVTGTDGVQTLEAEAVFIATGSVPRTLPGLEGEMVVTSDEFLVHERVPSRAAVIGGGAIGCEFASYLADVGCEVTILEALDKILPGCDDDVTREVVRLFRKRGITVITGAKVQGHEPQGEHTTLQIEGSDPLEADLVVVAVGRRPFTEGLGLEGTGVVVDERGFVKVDDRCRTAEPGVYALGDVINTPQLAHVGFAEGILAVRDVLGEDPPSIDYSRVPWCIYSHPEVAFAGLSEEAARQAGFDVVTAKHRFGGSGRAMIVGDPDGLVKVIAERGSGGSAGRLLGVHMVGPWVTEQLGQGYLSVNWEATVDDVASLVQPHPTMSEVFGEAVMTLTGRGLHG